ncbi:ulvan-active sulfatase-like [Sycon ciliatum]|uniref:ulvan-active sulfatase-like n=1 Tax=Sycon ciliatum TaxID=27933 RepID=UPI0031F6CFE0
METSPKISSFLYWLCPVAAVLLVVASPPAAIATRQGSKPNVLMIAIDDLRPEFGQAFSVPEVKTPNMDKFVETGTVMQHSYVQVAVCGPSRSSILTGRRPDTTHSMSPFSWCWSNRGQFLTLPHYFKNNGYTTAGSGKLFHPDACGAADPHSLGDDKTAWTLPYFPEPECVQWGSVPCPRTKYWNNTMGDSVMVSPLDDDHLTDGQLAIHAQGRLANFSKQGIGMGDKPFFMAVGFHKPHLPHIAPKKYFDMYDVNQVSLPPNPNVPERFTKGAWYNSDEMQSYIDAHKQFPADGFSQNHPISDDDKRKHRQAYFAATSYVDAQVGRVMDALASNDYANNTIVVLWSDHGWHLGDTNSWGKCTNFESATHNTLMWRVPGKTNKGKSERLVEMLDLYPTLLELTGLPPLDYCEQDEPPTVNCLQGKSYASEFTGSTDQADLADAKQYAFSQWLYPGAIQPGLDSDASAPKPKSFHVGYTVRTRNGYRLTEYVPYNTTMFKASWSDFVPIRELYDYNADPYETVNHAYNTSYSEIVQQLHTVLNTQFS